MVRDAQLPRSPPCRDPRATADSEEARTLKRRASSSRRTFADDLDRIFEYLARNDSEGAPSRIRGLVDAIAVLESNPLIGRRSGRNLREFIIGRAPLGYVALYHDVPEVDTVFVLAIRTQREAGYRRD